MFWLFVVVVVVHVHVAAIVVHIYVIVVVIIAALNAVHFYGFFFEIIWEFFFSCCNAANVCVVIILHV